MSRFYSEAVKRGAQRYFTGKPCANGHIAERYTSTRSCCACAAGTQGGHVVVRKRSVTLHITSHAVLRAVLAVYTPIAASFYPSARADPAYAAAAAGNHAAYVNGRPCKHGHIATRSTVRRACIACAGHAPPLGAIAFTVESDEQAQRLRQALITATVNAELSAQ